MSLMPSKFQSGSMAQIQLIGAEELGRRLRNIGHRMSENALRAAMRKAMNSVKDRMDAKVPVKTGATQRTLTVRISSERVGVSGRFGTVMGKVDKKTGKMPYRYGLIVERKKPWMKPAFDAMRPEIIGTFVHHVDLELAKRGG